VIETPYCAMRGCTYHAEVGILCMTHYLQGIELEAQARIEFNYK
jgi:hypothetical protein